MEARDNGASFLQLLLGLEVDNAIWYCAVLDGLRCGRVQKVREPAMC